MPASCGSTSMAGTHTQRCHRHFSRQNQRLRVCIDVFAWRVTVTLCVSQRRALSVGLHRRPRVPEQRRAQRVLHASELVGKRMRRSHKAEIAKVKLRSSMSNGVKVKPRTRRVVFVKLMKSLEYQAQYRNCLVVAHDETRGPPLPALGHRNRSDGVRTNKVAAGQLLRPQKLHV